MILDEIDGNYDDVSSKYLVSITLWLFKRFRVEGFVLSVLRGGEGLSSTSGNRRTTSCKEGNIMK